MSAYLAILFPTHICVYLGVYALSISHPLNVTSCHLKQLAACFLDTMINTKALSVMIPKNDCYGSHGMLFSWKMYYFIPLLPIQIISKCLFSLNLQHLISLKPLHKSIFVVQNSRLLLLLLPIHRPCRFLKTMIPLLKVMFRHLYYNDLVIFEFLLIVTAFKWYLLLHIPLLSQPHIHRLLIYHVGKM